MTEAARRHKSTASSLLALSQDDVQLPFTVGQLIGGKYEVIGMLGCGGMGYVISAKHVELGEVVALKFLRPEALAYHELVERFAREARAAAKIKSEHVARVYDVGTLPDGVPFIVMEHLRGKDLADVLHQQGALPVKQAVEYIMQACEGLASAHANGIVHRDIKPENLFLSGHSEGMNTVKILDFGISKVALAAGKRDMVRTQMALGSPVYMSPEQIRSADQVDARTDIWAIGCVLFELVAGVPPFDEPSLLQLSAAILEREPTPLSALVPDAPAELEEIIARCLQKDPELRFQNVAELAFALYSFAPRRSRISAERSFHTLKSAGIVRGELELQSEFPPSLSAVSGTMRTVSSRTGAATPTSSLNSAASRPSVGVDTVPSLRPPRKSKLVLWVALGLLGAVGLALAVQSRDSSASAKGSAAATPGAASQAPASAAQTGAATATAPARVEDLDADASAAPSASGSAAGDSKKPRAKRAAPAYVAPANAAKRGQARGRDGDDLDPGF